MTYKDFKKEIENINDSIFVRREGAYIVVVSDNKYVSKIRFDIKGLCKVNTNNLNFNDLDKEFRCTELIYKFANTEIINRKAKKTKY